MDFALQLLSGAAGDIRAAAEAQMRRYVRRAMVRSTFLLVAIGLLIVAGVMMAVAAYLALAAIWAPPLAALVTAIGTLAVAGLLLAAAFHEPPAPARPERQSSAGPTRDEIDAIASEIASLGDSLHDSARRNSPTLVVAALTAGLVVALMRRR